MPILYELMLQRILGIVSMSINNLLRITINNIIRFLLSFVYIILISPSNHRSYQPTAIIGQISILFYIIFLICICVLRVTSDRLFVIFIVILYFMRVIGGFVDICIWIFFFLLSLFGRCECLYLSIKLLHLVWLFCIFTVSIVIAIVFVVVVGNCIRGWIISIIYFILDIRINFSNLFCNFLLPARLFLTIYWCMIHISYR